MFDYALETVPILDEALIKEISNRILGTDNHKIYFDHGTLMLDRDYKSYKERVNELFTKAGYTASSYKPLKFEGHEHSERFWNRRVT